MTSDSSQDALARIGLDWGFLGSEEGATPLLCGRCSKQRWYFGIPVPRKGVDDYAVDSAAHQISLSGHRRIVMGSDSEPAMLAFKRAVASKLMTKYGVEVVPEDSHQSSQSNSLAEQGVREVKQKARSMRHAVYEFLGIKVKADEPAMAWLVSWAALSINIGRRGADGRTAWELRHGRECKRLVAKFGETVMWKMPKPPRGVEDRWQKGCWLGLALRSENSFVSDQKGDVHECRTFRRLPMAEAVNKEMFASIRGTPWKPSLAEGEVRPRVLIDAAPAVNEDELPVPPEAPLPGGPRRLYIRANVELKRHGYSPGCGGCAAAQAGLPPMGHSDACRRRIESELRKVPEGRQRLRVAEERARAAAGEAAPGSSVVEAGRQGAGPILNAPVQMRMGRDEVGNAPDTGGASASGGADVVMEPRRESVKRSGEGEGAGDEELLQANKSRTLEPMWVSELRVLSEQTLGSAAHVDAVDFAELFNPGCFAKEARTFGLVPGGVYDLRTGFNLSLESDRSMCWAELQESDPYLVIGAPLCGPFSSWQRMPKNAASPTLEEKIAEAKEHLDFACRIYKWQALRGKCFVHEHPWSAASWKLGFVKEVSDLDGVEIRRGDQCPFGQVARDADGEGLVQKATGWMSNCPEVLDEVARRCVNPTLPECERHRHVHLQNGLAKGAERYPVALVKAILKGLRNHLRRHRHGSLFHVEALDTGPTLDEPPPEWRPEPAAPYETRVGRFFDSVTGFELDPERVRKARAEEVDFMLKLGVWKVVDVNEATAVTGRPPISVSWVDTNKGDEYKPILRSRLVVNETKRVSGHMDPGEVFSATPPLECIRMQCSLMMSINRPTLGAEPEDDLVILLLDISRAHLHCPMRREVYTRLPLEHPEGGNAQRCGKLVMTVYGCRDAGQNFELAVYDALAEAGSTRGSTNPCCYRHDERRLSISHHGDDFTIMGRRGDAHWMEARLGKRFLVKNRGCLGPRAEDVKEVSLLHRIIQYYGKDAPGGERIEFQADPRHAEVLVKMCGLDAQTSKGVSTPGIKVPVNDDTQRKLGSEEATLFRSICMRLGYLSLDRPDLQYVAKECARGMAEPEERHLIMLKRAARYLLRAPALVWTWKKQKWPGKVCGHSDTDWAGCPVTRKSTNGTALTFGTHTWFTQSSTQAPISLSSGEAEFYGLVKTGSRSIGTHNLCKDLGFEIYGSTTLEVSTDSVAAKGIAVRRGVGKVRHLETGSLWVQAAVAAGRFTLVKVDGYKNPPDIMTKHVDAVTLQRHLATLRLRVSHERPATAARSLVGGALMREGASGQSAA